MAGHGINDETTEARIPEMRFVMMRAGRKVRIAMARKDRRQLMRNMLGEMTESPS